MADDATNGVRAVIRMVSPREAVRDWFSLYEPQIARVLERADGPHWPDDILTCVQRQTMQLWRTVEGDGIGVTELQSFPRYKQLLVYMVAGENAQDWLPEAHQQLVAFALSQNCTRLEFHGRPGWAKWCRALGYEHSSIRMKCDLRKVTDGRRRTTADAEHEDGTVGSAATVSS